MRTVFALEDIILDPNLGLLGLRLGASLFDRAEITDVVDPKIVVPVCVFAGFLFPTFKPPTRTWKTYMFLLLEALAAILEGREQRASYPRGFVQARISSRSKIVRSPALRKGILRWLTQS